MQVVQMLLSDIPAEQFFDGSPDRVLGDFLHYEFQPRDPAVLQEALQQEQHSREQARSGDFKAHISASHSLQASQSSHN